MSVPMNDKTEEVELPSRPEPERMKQFATSLLGYRYVQHAEFVRYADQIEAQLKAALSANRKKDAEIERLNRYLDGVAGHIGQMTRLVQRSEKSEAELSSLRASVDGEKWIEIKAGGELPPFGVPVWVVMQGTVQHAAYSRDIGEWNPCAGDGDSAPDGTFSHFRYIHGPKE